MATDQYRASLPCVIGLFEWPESRTPDPDWIVAQIPEPDNSRFENGYGYTVISTQHECAWYMAWLDSRRSGDTVSEAQALDVMTTVVPVYESVIPGFPPNFISPEVVEYREAFAANAALGDPTRIQGFVTGNCEIIQWASGS